MIIFDNHDIGDLFMVGDPVFTWLASEPEYVSVPGRDGVAVQGSRFGLSRVSFSIATLDDKETRRSRISILGRWLDVDSPRRLYLPDTPARYYMAMPSGSAGFERLAHADRGTLAFDIVEPAAYGATKSETIPSGGAANIHIEGTYPTRPTIRAASAVRDAESTVWGVRVDDGDFVYIPTGSAASRKVDIDCAERTATITASRTPVLPTLDSDWLVLEPGDHTIEMDKGTGAATIEWVERWL